MYYLYSSKLMIGRSEKKRINEIIRTIVFSSRLFSLLNLNKSLYKKQKQYYLRKKIFSKYRRIIENNDRVTS